MIKLKYVIAIFNRHFGYRVYFMMIYWYFALKFIDYPIVHAFAVILTIMFMKDSVRSIPALIGMLWLVISTPIERFNEPEVIKTFEGILNFPTEFLYWFREKKKQDKDKNKKE